MNLYYESDSLQHYGVKGMKWGVRKSDRVKSWKKRQHSRLDDYTKKDQARWDKKIARTKNKIKNKGSTAERREKLRTLEGKKKASKAMNEIGHKRLDKLGSKDYDKVVQREIIATGASVASMALASAGMMPIYMIHIPSMDLNLNQYRVRHSDEEDGVAL